MEVTLIDKLALAARHPMAFVAYVLLIGGWVYYVFAAKRAKIILEGMKGLTDAKQVAAARFLIQPDLSRLPMDQRYPAWRDRLKLVAFIATIVAVMVFAGIGAHIFTQSDSELMNQMGTNPDPINPDAAPTE